jgi:hypothetical protein
MDIFPIASSLLGLVFPVALIVGIVLVIRRAKGSDDVPGIGTTRRLFLYGLAFISLMLATSGVTLLVASTLEGIFDSAIGRGGNSGQAAFGLAATIVGFPIWLLLLRAGTKSLVTYPGEAGTLGRKFYTYSVMMIAAIVVAFTATQTLSGIFEWDNLNVSDFAAPLVWGAVWYFHWRTEIAEGQPSLVAVTMRRLYVYLTAGYGLVMLAVGAAVLLHGLLANAYAGLFTDALNNFGIDDLWNDDVRISFAIALVGGSYWWFHWHRATDGDHTSELRLAAVYVLGIFGGLVVTVSGISIAVFGVLKWILDRQSGTSAASHFDMLPAAIAATIAGVALWKYHRIVSQQDAAEDEQRSISGNRVYSYLSAAVGLATLAIGVSILVGVVVGLITSAASSGVIVGTRWWGAPLAAAFTSLIVGAPLWVRHWLQWQASAVIADPTERTTLSRRAYMFSVFGIAVLATLISASVVLFRILQAIFENEIRASVFFDVRWGFGVVAAAALVSYYHWQVMKEDRALEPEPESGSEAESAPSSPPKRVTAVASTAARSTIDRIASQANATVTLWERRDDAGVPTLTDEQASEYALAVSNATGEHVLIVIDRSGVQVIPL